MGIWISRITTGYCAARIAGPAPLAALLLLFAMALTTGPAAAQSASCGGSIGISNVPGSFQLTQVPLGQVVRVTLNPAKSNLSEFLTIDHVEYALTCANNGDDVPCEFGNDTTSGGGMPITYVGNVGNEAGNCGATNASTTDHGDGTVTFNFPPFDLDNAGCTITFDVEVQDRGTDSTPLTLTSAADSEGQCGENLQGSARGSAQLNLQSVPSIELVKEISVDGGTTWLDANDSASAPVVTFPSGAMYRLRLENNGTADLVNITVSDPSLGIADFPVANLPIGASVIIDSGTIPELSVAQRCDSGGTFENVASVQADSADDESPVTDSDSANLVCIRVDLAIEKTDGDIPFVAEGGTLVYTLTYTNLGSEDLTGVVITETVPVNTVFNTGASTAGWSCANGSPAGTNCTFSVPGTVAAGAGGSVQFGLTVLEVWEPDPETGQCPAPPENPLVDNTASIVDDGSSGADADSSNNSDSDDTPITTFCEDIPEATLDIRIEKTPNNQTIQAGQTAQFTIAVTNTGEANLVNVVVTDPLAPDCDRNIGNLAVGATVVYNCSRPNVIQSFKNVATVTGEGEEDGEVSDDDDADVTVLIVDEPEQMHPIPTLSQWGLILMVALTLMLGLSRARVWTRR